jgi:hypothetical protein
MFLLTLWVLMLNLIAWFRWGLSCDVDHIRLVVGSARDHACSHFRGAGRIDWVLFLPTGAAAAAAVAAAILRQTRGILLSTVFAIAAIAGLLFVFLMPTVLPN